MKPLILLTGATGYIGGRLLKLFEAERHPVRCLVRRPEFFRGRVAPETDVIAGDLLDSESLRKAMNGVHAAYYLVHSMGTSQGFEETDRRAAECFAGAARAEGIRRIIYLGGLGDRLGQAFAAFAQPPGGRGDSEAIGRARHRVSSIDCPRIGQSLV